MKDEWKEDSPMRVVLRDLLVADGVFGLDFLPQLFQLCVLLDVNS